MLFRLACSIIFFIPFFYSSVSAQKFVVYGDTRDAGAIAIHTSVVARLANENPDLILHVGDMASDFGSVSSDFLPVIRGNTVTKALWDANNFLVCYGGSSHDGSESDMKGISPPMVRDNSVKYAFSSADGKVFFIVGGYKLEDSGDIPWLISALQSAAAKSARWRVLITHALVWNNTDRNGRQIGNQAAVKAICDSLHVDLTFCGHDHYFQRSKLMKNDNILQEGSSFTGSEGTVANVVGNGGTAFYPTGQAGSFVEVQDNTFHGYSVVAYEDNSLTVSHKNSSGSLVDEYTLTRGLAPESYMLTTSAENGTITLNPAGGSYASGTEVTVTAVSESGYAFDSWSGDLAGSNNPETITMNADKSVTANFITEVVPVTPPPPEINVSIAPGPEIRIFSQSGEILTVAFSLPEVMGEIRIDIDDIHGKNVRTFPLHEALKGNHERVLDPTAGGGGGLRSGLYICRLVIGGRSRASSIMMVR